MRKSSSFVFLSVLAANALPLACGSSTPTASPPEKDASTADSGITAVAEGGDSSLITNRTLVSVTITPPSAAIESLNGMAATQQFQLMAQYNDGTVAPVNATWSADSPQVGTIGGVGLYTASGTQGGSVTIAGAVMGKSATATLVVKLHLQENPGSASGSVQGSLQGATSPDTQVVWAYPYDATVFPRGISEAPLMWNGGAPSDLYYVHVTSPTFELESYTTASIGRYDFADPDWLAFVNSTNGASELRVARWNGTAATLVADQHWSVAPASMRGTIYYWANDTARVMRVRGGATMPDDFLGASVACPSCHTVSANGQQLFMSEGDWDTGDTAYNFSLQSAQNTYSGFAVDGGAPEWSLPAISPDGTVLVENFSPLRGNIGVTTGAFNATNATAIPSTGLEGHPLGMPSFSPDGQLLAYVDTGSSDLRAFDWDLVNKKATNDRLLVSANSGAGATYPIIEYPSVSPDHQWVVYGRGTALGSLGVPGDLYAVSVANPGTEIPLNALNGASYPFAAGTRDQDLDYEPTFAPVAAGGYFWIVFHSRRTWGNALIGPAFIQEGQGVKQLWVAAFDQTPKSGKDPSHSAFHLPGQGASTLNMRGYWALDPCKGNGAGCQSGVECCGGYCGTDGSDAGLVCASASSGCGQDGDKCVVSTDCCGAAMGVTCINAVCAVPPPQ